MGDPRCGFFEHETLLENSARWPVDQVEGERCDRLDLWTIGLWCRRCFCQPEVLA